MYHHHAYTGKSLQTVTSMDEMKHERKGGLWLITEMKFMALGQFHGQGFHQ
jgi:hypothetical protein